MKDLEIEVTRQKLIMFKMELTVIYLIVYRLQILYTSEFL